MLRGFPRFFPRRVFAATTAKRGTPSAAGATSTFSTSTLHQLRDRVEAGKLEVDRRQITVAKKLDKLGKRLHGLVPVPRPVPAPEPEEAAASDAKPTDVAETAPAPAPTLVPRGYYIHGEVGVGKSMLMDMFVASSPLAAASRVRRCHFHQFMLELHERIHAWKQHDLATHGRDFHIEKRPERDAITQVAHDIADEVSLLALDEFQVTDIVDAMLMSSLFSVLWARGVVLVATSNRPPQALYEGGVNREYFTPFIGHLERHCLVLHMASREDYRQLATPAEDVYFYGHGADAQLDASWDGLGGAEAAVAVPVRMGRTLEVARSRQADDGERAARFRFDELCSTDIGAADYRALTTTHGTVYLEGVPRMDLSRHNEARRFITLVDELYEAGVAVVVSSDVDIDDLFAPEENRTPDADGGALREALDLPAPSWDPTGHSADAAQAELEHGVMGSELASVAELAWAFARAQSRLVEMSGHEWRGERARKRVGAESDAIGGGRVAAAR